jgi:hypothetical protein
MVPYMKEGWRAGVGSITNCTGMATKSIMNERRNTQIGIFGRDDYGL